MTIIKRATSGILFAALSNLLGCAVSPTNVFQGIDFRNFRYEHLECDDLPKTVIVKSGIFTAKPAGYKVDFSVEKILYGDLDGDSKDEAIVLGHCAMQGANYTLAQVFIYSMNVDKVVLLSTLTDLEMEQHYRRFYPDGSLWQLQNVKYEGNVLIVERYAEGAHCCPEYMVSSKYRIVDNQLIMLDKPVRMAIRQN